MRARQDHLSLNRAAFQGPALLTNINVVMGRPAKNVNHPLVRLRRKLSDWSAHKVTRQDLAKKAGIPESSLRDIETGRYKLTPAVATKISFATGVDPQSLLDGDDPLLDLLRQPFSRKRVPDGQNMQNGPKNTGERGSNSFLRSWTRRRKRKSPA
jgi:transcriptional regulator with XRE-family HTH domain